MKILWDEPKRQANLAKHGMDFASLDLDFFASAVVIAGKAGRSMAVGRLNGATTIIYVHLGSEAISVISMRPASRAEKRLL